MNNPSSLAELYKLVIDTFVEKNNISDSAYNIWFRPLVPVEMTGDKVILAIDVPFKKDTIDKYYTAKIEEQFRETCGLPVTVEVIVRENSSEPEPVFGTGNMPAVPSVDKTFTYTFENFIVGPSNNLAFAAARAVAKKQHEKYNPLFIYGDSGLGKTHLLSAIQHEMMTNYPGINIIYIPAETFTNEFLHSISQGTVDQFDEKYRSVDALLIDDIQFIAGKDQTEEKFFHIFNELYNQNKVIVLTADRPAKEIPSIPDRLKTRFSSGLIADVKPPEYETRLLIIKRKAELLDFHISDEVVEFIASKLKSNIRQIEGVVTKLNALYVVSQIHPSITMAQSAIQDIAAEHQPIPVTVDKIIGEVGKIYSVTPDEMRSQKRAANISNARKVAVYVIQQITGLSYEAIGKEFNGRDHSTIVYAINNIKEKMEKDSSFRSVVEDIIKNIKANQ